MDLPKRIDDITVDWLNHALHENGFLGSANVVSLKHDQLGLQGYQSDTARLTLAFDRDTIGVPRTMIAKIPPADKAARQGLIGLNLFEREIRFYREIAPKSPIRTPKLIFSAMDSVKQKYVLLIEDCSYATPADPDLKGLTVEQVRIVVSKMADFHARWWKSHDLSSFAWMPKYKDDMKARLAGIRSAWDSCARISEFRKALPDAGWEASKRIVEEFPKLAESLPEDKLTINQFDLKSDNMFFDWDSPEDPFILFDWAPVCIGRGVTDLSRLFGSSLETDLLRRVGRELLTSYCRRLLERGISDYTFSECWTDYLRGLMLRTGISLVAYPRLSLYGEERRSAFVVTNLRRLLSAVVDNDATSVLP